MTGRSDFTLFKTLPADPQPWISVRTLCLFLTIVALLFLTPEGLQRYRAMKLAEKVKQHGGMVKIEESLLDQINLGTMYLQANAFWGNIQGIYMRPSDSFQIDDNFISELDNLRTIKYLTLGTPDKPTVITDQGAPFIKQPNLWHLSITGGSMTDNGFNELAEINSLGTLGLHHLSITGDQLPPNAFPNLKMLDLSNTQFTNQGLKKLSPNSSLVYLHLGNTNVSSAGLQELSKFPNLRSLCLNNLKIDAAALAKLAVLKRLYKLELQGTAVDDAVALQLSQLSQITVLKLYQSQVTDHGLRHLATMKNLENLFLPGSKITDEGLTALNQITKLDYLDLSGTHITDAGLRQLSNLPGLRMLNLSNTRVTDQAKEILLTFPKLESIEAFDTSISPAIIEDIRDAGIDVSKFHTETSPL